MMKKTIKDVDLKGKRVLVRVDFNIPLKDGKIRDDRRIKASLPTLEYIREHGGRLIVMSHLGRPKGEVMEEFRMKPVAIRLSELMGIEVKYCEDCNWDVVKKVTSELEEGDVLLLENLRFHKGETKNDPALVEKLLSLGDVYVNDAFGTCHRAHASTAGIPETKKIPSVAGFLVEKELDMLGKILIDPARPVVAILGGAKVTDKIGVIENLITKVDSLLIGGGMSYTFLKSEGYEIGTSLLDGESLTLGKELMGKAAKRGVDFLLPVDIVVAKEIKEGTEHKVVDKSDIPSDWMGVDIGPETIQKFGKIIRGAKTIFWNGPLGVFEIDEFSRGTEAIAKFIAENNDAISLIGGGDSAAAAEKLGFADKMTHISTGGGASLEFMEGKELPGIAALDDKT
ncbi:MAG TPA: phosphoglycerate kinase [Candidatus Eremiobacteraeota bacterium]|nr:phosphoglycerate kinase [Candidatus Eremiobacteraeota bacterium]